MDVVTTSLDALLQRATNPQNQNIDTAAVEAFCALVNKEKDGAHIGVKLIASRIHSQQEKEVLQTLHILDICMQRCGGSFQGEVGKFRFLNEMIKLVSPKYLGSQTPLSVRQKVLQLMYLWTLDYPKETKIKEAYDMLKKQGVIREVPLSVSSENNYSSGSERKANSIFQDEEKSKLLQKLLQSKNPEDLQAANRLIKSMVKEDDKRAELKSKRISELESVHNNVRLLNEMLDSYKPNFSSKDELELINELHQSCEKFRPSVIKLVSEMQQNEDMLGEVLQASDELSLIFEKYTSIIIQGKKPTPLESLKAHTNLTGNLTANTNLTTNLDANKFKTNTNNISLLDFEPLEDETVKAISNPSVSQSDIDVLTDIFAVETTIPEKDILQPTSVLKTTLNSETVTEKNKLKALEDLDALGEHLLRENLQSSTTRLGPQFNKIPDKIPMNLLPKQNELKSLVVQNQTSKINVGDALDLDLSYLLDKSNLDRPQNIQREDSSTDDILVDISGEIKINDNEVNKIDVETNGNHKEIESKAIYKEEIKCNKDINKSVKANNKEIKGVNKEIKDTNKESQASELKLSDLFVKLESIKPSSVTPITALEEKNGISVTLHFAKDKPHDDVIVIVVTILSKNENPLKNILFRAIVPKTCKVKLQPPSSSDLPAFNPFLPPSAITQIMLIANPEKVKASLKFIVSYNIDDETTTEMGEIENLPDVV